MAFQQKLNLAVEKNNSLLCVGLDSDLDKIPKKFLSEKYPQYIFNKWVIDQTYDLVCAFKINSAFYEARGEEGIRELKMTFDYLANHYHDTPTILDSKRADIGNTNNGYIQFAFNYLSTDSITINPYPGKIALKPFLDRADKGLLVWCKTSNPGAFEFQDLKIDGRELYKIVAEKVCKEWNANQNCMLVVGATYPMELAEIRKIVGDMTLLIPGIGAQGGDIEKTVKAGQNSKKSGIIVNSSRSIIFSNDPKKEAEKLRNEINKYRT